MAKLSGTNQARQSGRFEIYPDGKVVLWTQSGPVACFSAREAGNLMYAVSQGAPFHAERCEANDQTPLFETYAAFHQRGGEITLGNHALPPKQKKEWKHGMTIEDLDL